MDLTPLSRQLTEHEIDEAQRLRGWFVNSYAQIEHLLGAFIVTSIGMPEYASLGSDLPHRVKGRVTRIKAIAAMDGPLKNYSDFMEYMIHRFEGWEEIRNLLAHGFCEFVVTPEGDRGMRFKKWHREKGRWKPDLRQAEIFGSTTSKIRSESSMNFLDKPSGVSTAFSSSLVSALTDSPRVTSPLAATG